MLAFFTVVGMRGYAQHGEPIDVSACFSDILVDKTVNLHNERLRYAALSVWNKEMFDSAKQSGTLGILIHDLPVNAGFSSSDELRLKEFYMNHENLKFDESTASATFFLDPQAGEIIKSCVQRMVASNFGFYTVYYNNTERNTILGLYWNWAPSTTPLKIRTKNIENAIITDDHGKHPADLLPPPWFGWSRLPNSPDFISLERKDPEKSIVITLETDPNVGGQYVVIPPVSHKETCTEEKEPKDHFGTAYHYDAWFHPEQLHVDYDDGQGHKYFTIQVNINDLENGKDGVISDARCTKATEHAPGDFFELTNTGTHTSSTATCQGWWQSLGRLVKISIDWYKVGYKCTPIPWDNPQTVSRK
jgi:hypothetical protein